jgi:hypothetical protein
MLRFPLTFVVLNASVGPPRPLRSVRAGPQLERSAQGTETALISRCSEARERTMNRSEWSSETRTDDTNGGYRRTPETSIDATRTVFSVATPGCAGGLGFITVRGRTSWNSGMTSRPPVIRKVLLAARVEQAGASARKPIHYSGIIERLPAGMCSAKSLCERTTHATQRGVAFSADSSSIGRGPLRCASADPAGACPHEGPSRAYL